MAHVLGLKVCIGLLRGPSSALLAGKKGFRSIENMKIIYDFDIQKNKPLSTLDGPSENLVMLLFRLLACII